jgi:hypothetical protein
MTEIEKHQIHGMHNPDPHGRFTESLPLNDNLFTRELGYQVSLSMAEYLLKSGIMTGAEFHRAKSILLERFRPPIGSLLAEAG